MWSIKQRWRISQGRAKFMWDAQKAYSRKEGTIIGPHLNWRNIAVAKKLATMSGVLKRDTIEAPA